MRLSRSGTCTDAGARLRTDPRCYMDCYSGKGVGEGPIADAHPVTSSVNARSALWCRWCRSGWPGCQPDVAEDAARDPNVARTIRTPATFPCHEQPAVGSKGRPPSRFLPPARRIATLTCRLEGQPVQVIRPVDVLIPENKPPSGSLTNVPSGLNRIRCLPPNPVHSPYAFSRIHTPASC